jgi:LysR family nitrogen assimilation transcriptional regulator
MDLVQLKYFVSVAEQGSFSTAGLQLDIAQPTLSKRIRALEVELRTHLFYRTGRGAQLTPAGRRFLDHARGVLRATDAAIESMREGASIYEGRVAAGLPPTVGRTVIPAYVESFAERFPQAALSLVEGLSHSLYDQLLAGRLDFAVLRNPMPSTHLAIELIRNEGFYLIGAKPVGKQRDAVRIADLEGLRFVMPTAPHTFRPLLEAAMARRGSVLNVVYEVDAVGSLLDLAVAGRGYTLIPDSTFRTVPPPANASVQRIDAPELYTSLCLATPVFRPQTQLSQEATSLAREIIIGHLG